MAKKSFDKSAISKIKEKMKSVASERKSVHVIPQKDRWAVVKEGETLKAYGTFSSKQDAITRARDLAQKGDRNAVIIHRRDATVEKWEEISEKAAK